MNAAANEIGLSIFAEDRRGLLRDIAACLASHQANIDSIHLLGQGWVDLHLDVSDLDDLDVTMRELHQVEGVQSVRQTDTASQIFGSRVIVMGGGAQVSQVVLGAVSEADRHNLRGERISVDTIPLVGEERLAAAVRAVARLPRVKILVLAGSLMGGDITAAVRELQKAGIAVISLNMVGSVPEVADLVVTDPVQAGVMAVMAVATTARFDIARVRGRRF